MKKIIFNILAIVIIAGFSTNVMAQTGATATATATATIVTPIAITKAADMNFGILSVNTTLGTVVLEPAGTRTTSGGVKLPSTTGTVSPASFNVTGETGYGFAITLPTEDYTITRATGTETMTVNTFTTTSLTGELVDGSQTISIGATLNVTGAQVAGVYSNETGYPVTVNYN